MYDGPFCVLSVVDNRRYNRLAFRVLEHDPSQEDVRAFLSEFKEQLDKRGLRVRGITTDGSSLYPEVLKELWPKAPHQVCVFHVLQEILKAVLRVLAKLRKERKAQIPKQRRGRPRQQDKARVRRIQRLQQRVAELFTHRHLFVRRHLSAAQKKLLKRLVRGQPQLRVLRDIMDEVYRLFDRRCKTATALRRLEKLRQRVRRFKRLARALAVLNSPNLEKALLYLDDKLLGATSNAVERSNRRFRKAQKSIYSVRTKGHIEQRLALDMNREQRAAKRARTLKTLHRARSDPESGHYCCYSVKIDPKKVHAVYAASHAESFFEKSGKPDHRPKALLQRVAESGNRNDDADFRAEVAECTDPAELERHCPEGFKPFAAALRTAFPATA